MNTRVWSGVCVAVAFACSAAVLAQSAPPSQTSSSSMAAKNITVTGCVERAASATGTTGTTGSTRPSDDTKFVLKNVMPSTTSATGTSGSSSSSTASEYRLDTDDSKLTPHVGHKVEITGTLEQAMSTSSSSTPAGATASASVSAPKIKVESVKMVASTCP